MVVSAISSALGSNETYVSVKKVAPRWEISRLSAEYSMTPSRLPMICETSRRCLV
jgi:hypothetical protein